MVKKHNPDKINNDVATHKRFAAVQAGDSVTACGNASLYPPKIKTYFLLRSVTASIVAWRVPMPASIMHPGSIFFVGLACRLRLAQ